MFCPKCASAVVLGQRFCRNCGLKLDVIVDAIEGKSRGPFDFEMLKRDLRDLGSSLRAGFEGAGIPINKTQKLNQPPAYSNSPPQVIQTIQYNWSKELNKALRKVKAANTRKYSLQQAILSLFGGGAMMAAWYYIFNALANSGMIQSLQTVIFNQTGEYIYGIAPFIEKLWLLALIPIARGVAHLINGIFIAPKKIEESEADISAAYAQVYGSPISSIPAGSMPSTRPEQDAEVQAPSNMTPSVTEDETLRFEPR